MGDHWPGGRNALQVVAASVSERYCEVRPQGEDLAVLNAALVGSNLLVGWVKVSRPVRAATDRQPDPWHHQLAGGHEYTGARPRS